MIENILMEEPQSFALLEDRNSLVILIIFIRNMLMQPFLLPVYSVY